MFTQPCFIRKNTPDLRKKLEELGYYRHPSYGDNEYLYLNRGFYHTNVVGYSEEIERMIDCGVNEELFLALAALRDDTDKNQYCIDSEGNWFLYNRTYVRLLSKTNVSWHKATLQELIEHFKK